MWSTTAALDFKRDVVRAERLIQFRAQVGACPNCGAVAAIDLIDVSSAAAPDFAMGNVECSARCWQKDPDAYIAAVHQLSR